jgi:hypothetical protein
MNICMMNITDNTEAFKDNATMNWKFQWYINDHASDWLRNSVNYNLKSLREV